MTDFTNYDYIGAPWTLFNGVAGGGGVSVRNATLMLSLLNRELASLPQSDKQSAFLKWGQDDEFFVSRIVRALAGGEAIRLAPEQVSVGQNSLVNCQCVVSLGD